MKDMVLHRLIQRPFSSPGLFTVGLHAGRFGLLSSLAVYGHILKLQCG
jgi:hypothetical protein